MKKCSPDTFGKRIWKPVRVRGTEKVGQKKEWRWSQAPAPLLSIIIESSQIVFSIVYSLTGAVRRTMAGFSEI